MAQKGIARWVFLLVVSFGVHTAIIVNNTETALWNAQGREGELLARQIADAAAPLMLTRDKVSLSILSSQYEQHGEVGSLRIYNNHNELVSESLENHRNGRLFPMPIHLQQQELGHLELRLAPPSVSTIVNQSAANLGLSLLLHFIIFVAGLLFVSANRQQAAPVRAPRAEPAPAPTEPAAPAPAPTEAHPEEANTEHCPVTLLHLALDDPRQLLTRVNAAMADELLTFFDQLVDRVATLYGGIVETPFSTEGVQIRFEQEDTHEREFHAIAAAALFMQLVESASVERRRHQLLCLDTKAGILHSQQTHKDLPAITQKIAELAPSRRILGTRPRSPLNAFCRFGSAYPLQITEHDSLTVVMVENLAPEYAQLVHNQCQQILQLEEDE